jgi:hypothetical protein
METCTVKEWLSKELKCRLNHIEDLYNNKTAIEFLFVWSRFESRYNAPIG